MSAAMPQTRRPAREWIPILKAYRDPSLPRSLWELATTFVPYVTLWAIAWWSLSAELYWITIPAVILTGMLMMRMFAIQHDCGHGAIFKSWAANRWLGRCLGVICIAPAAVWAKKHDVHHATHGNLDRREMGDLLTLTVAEYNAKGPLAKAAYRLYRNPYFLLAFGPFYSFFLEYRLPFRLMDRREYWISAMGTNLSIAIVLGTIYYFGGWGPILFIFVPSTLIGAFCGVWVFYIQHQFEGVEWDHQGNWSVHDSALYGSSYYVLPGWLNWFSCNVGIHHVHHLYARIAFYRLPEVLRDHPELAGTNRVTFRDSLKCMKLKLWDEDTRRMVDFAAADAKAAQGALAPAE
ncbi:Beta-carotene ketolase [Litoreibacter arenae DSM 19593]|uniref:Beta-carotene ketolase n=2 Tax=Litoreibacter TaxID=947567 RepID=S9RU68_9RHOB|nr:Beta-carotene ketolase [Litoreibacter arenae DSM 19593]